jgi:hypothetical protein
MSLANYTSPCAVVFDGMIWVFYNGPGNNGTFWTYSVDGVTWASISCLDDDMGSPISETFESGTSLSAAVYQDTLYVVWNTSAANGTLRYTYWSKASGKFVPPSNVIAGGLSIRSQTTPAMIAFNGLLYLFSNGSGQNGTWMTTFNGNAWTNVSPVTSNIGGNFMDRTSPAVFISDDQRALTLLWSGSGSNGVWYTTTTNGITWSNQKGFNSGIGLSTRSSPCWIDYQGRPYIFYIGEYGNLWNLDGVMIYSTLTGPKYSLAMDALLKGNDFAFVAQDDATV